MKKGVFATFDEHRVEDVLRRLKAKGFGDSQISVLIPGAREPRSLSLQQDVRHGAVTGGIAGILAAEFTTIGTLALAGVGSVLVAGPLLFAIGGAAIGGGAVGGVIGGLAAGTGDLSRWMGIPHSVVERRAKELNEGRGLILVGYESAEERRQARQVFLDAGVSDISETEKLRYPQGA